MINHYVAFYHKIPKKNFMSIEQQKNKNRESDGVLSFDGFQWMGGHDNQPRWPK